ncbi:Putative AC transposase [Linum perenne]
MHVDQLPVVEPNNNGNQVQPPEEIVVANDNHQTPTEEEAVTSPGQGKRKSPVWDHFERVKINDIWKAKCNYCRKLLGGDSSNGTSHLRSHVKSCIQKRIHDGSQKVLSPNLLIKGKTELVATAYNPEVSKKELATAVLMHEYPLSIVEHLHFKRFCYSLQPLFNVPSRNTLKRDVMRLYFDERAKIQRLIDSSKGRVAITTDMWTASNERKGYMAVTAHYIDNGWCLRSQLLRFMYVPAPHTADRLARFLVDCLMEWNVDTKILCDLILEYQSRHTKNQSSVGVGTSDLENGTSTSNDLDFELFLTQRKKARTTAVVTELDNYLNEDVLPRSSDFDILMWWKLSGLKYPILQAVARDVLVIPVTSVASESAFSSGGRLLDPHRSKLHSATVEALMCTRSWLKDEYERGTPI